MLTTIVSALSASATNSVRFNQCQNLSFNCIHSTETLISTLDSQSLQNQIRNLRSSSYEYRKNKQYSQAIAALETVLKLAQQAGDLDAQWWTLADLAETYKDSGNLNKALELHQQNFQFFQQNSQRLDTPGRGYPTQSYLYISNIYTLLKNYPKAIELINKALAIEEKNNSPTNLIIKATVLQKLGINLFLSGKLSEAESTLSQASATYEKGRQATSHGNLPTADQYEYEIELNRWRQQVLIAQNRTNEALELAEKNRARALVALLANRLRTSPQFQPTIDAPNIEQIKQIAKVQNATLVQYTLTYEYNPAWILAYENNEEIKVTNLFIWVIKPTGEVIFRRSNLTGNNLSLMEIVRQTRESIGARGLAVQSIADRVDTPVNTQSKGQLRQLHQLLIQPIANFLPTEPNSRVIFIPQDFLFLVPFAALQDNDGKYLIEKHTTLISPSIQVLDLTHSQQQKNQELAQGALIVGNPTMPSMSFAQGSPPQQLPSLPGSEQEANAIAKLFNTQPIIGSQATKSAVLQQISTARIVHLATHGILDNVGGFFSSLALTPTNQDQGFLTAREVISMKLNTELVVLSACNTGRGKINGDGVLGLSRSFIGAGVPSVIVSLWSVPDAPTASLMTIFYQNLKSGSDKAQALRQAMLKTMKQFPNPINWAAFTLIGEANSSKMLQSTMGAVSVSNNGHNNSNQAAVGRYYTVLPIPDNVTNYFERPSQIVPGEIDVNFATTMSVEELVNFYRQTFQQRGLTERNRLTNVTNNSLQLVFTGSPNGRKIVIQANKWERDLIKVFIRFE